MSAKRKSISSDLKKLDKISDKNIDYSDSPELDESFFVRDVVTLPQKKDSVTLRLDHDVLVYFKEQGKGYQTMINAVLKLYVHAHHSRMLRKRKVIKK
jgi:uncharacterized protein (DUF4415 family)